MDLGGFVLDFRLLQLGELGLERVLQVVLGLLLLRPTLPDLHLLQLLLHIVFLTDSLNCDFNLLEELEVGEDFVDAGPVEDPLVFGARQDQSQC